MRRPLAAFLAVSLCATWAGSLPAQEFGKLPAGEGQEEVFYSCSACHSIHLVTQQRLSRERWDEVLVWMVEEQGMPEFDMETRNLVLDYLGEHLSPD